MRGGRIHIPILAGHDRPASETPFKWPNIECWLGSFSILRGSGLVLLRNPIFDFFRGWGESGPLSSRPPLDPLMVSTRDCSTYRLSANASITNGHTDVSSGVKLDSPSSYKVKPVLSGHSKINKKGLKDKWYLNEGQKYCRMLSWSILQYFRTSIIDNRSSK